MKASRAPIVLLVVLSLILFFILGVRYGQRVEKTNKEVAAILKITPAQAEPTQTLSFKKYSNEACDLEFLYPSSHKVEKEQAESASFSDGKETVLAFSCAETDPFAKLQTDKVASDEVQFQQKPLAVKTSQLNGQKYLFLSLRNPVNAKDVYFIVEESLYPLLEGSLQFRLITPEPTRKAN